MDNPVIELDKTAYILLPNDTVEDYKKRIIELETELKQLKEKKQKNL